MKIVINTPNLEAVYENGVLLINYLFQNFIHFTTIINL